MAEVEQEGYIYIVDRKKDLIISGGESISQRAVEIALHKHPSISDCSVIEIHDDKWGEQVLGVVVLSENQKVTGELIDHCKKHSAKYKCPKRQSFLSILYQQIRWKGSKRCFERTLWKMINIGYIISSLQKHFLKSRLSQF